MRQPIDGTSSLGTGTRTAASRTLPIVPLRAGVATSRRLLARLPLSVADNLRCARCAPEPTRRTRRPPASGDASSSAPDAAPTRVGGPRGEDRRERAAEQEADARASRRRCSPAGSTTRACRSSGVASCTSVMTDTHWKPLPMPPRTENAHAAQSAFATRHAEVGERRSPPWSPSTSSAGERPAPSRTKARLPASSADVPRPPAGCRSRRRRSRASPSRRRPRSAGSA